MKVSFLKPPVGGIIGLEMITFVEPLGLECIASVLEADGHECQIVDLRIDGESEGLIKCEGFEPSIVGIQCNFTTERYRTVRLARQVRKRLPEALILVGGHDASRQPEWFVDVAINAISIGDGEAIMPGVVDAWERHRDLANVPGLLVNGPWGQHLTGPARGGLDLDSFPLPARHLITEYAPHYYINFNKPLALMETARGCPFRCNFCSVWKFHEKSFREKSADRVVEELAQIQAPTVFMVDDIFWLNPKRGMELAKRVKESGIRKYFRVQSRTDIICRHPELVEAWKECGRLSVFLGLESITDEGLKTVNKRNTAETNDRAIRLLQELDVGYTPNFIVEPTWGREDFKRLREWVRRTGAYNSGFSVLTPLPGTDLWDEVKDRVTTQDWELFDIAHAVLPTQLPLEEFYEEYASLWRNAVETRYRIHGKARTYAELGLALLTGRLTYGAIRKGMNMGQRLSRAETFLQAHRESEQRIAAAAGL